MPPNKFTFDVKPENLFEERSAQFVNWGLPEEQVRSLASTVSDTWGDGPGGWVYEWSKVGKAYEEQGDHMTAAMAFGAAKFPTISTQSRQDALAKQVDNYVKASPKFPVAFDRRIVTCSREGAEVLVPVHVLSHPEADSSSPVVIGSGGVDTWKMDLHKVWVAFALACRCHVVAFDLPGNGELSHVPMDNKSDQVIGGLIKFARELGNGIVCHFGFSMGGHYSALSGLRHDTDYAIVCGGPTDDSFTERNAMRLTEGFGMDGIMFNAIGRWTKMPETKELLDVVPMFSLKYLLDQDINCPMYVINGDSDFHISNADVTGMDGRKDTEVHLYPNTGHCCNAEPGAIKMMVEWLKTKFGP